MSTDHSRGTRYGSMGLDVPADGCPDVRGQRNGLARASAT